MSFIIVVGVVFVLLAAVVFASRRRFGNMTLALLAGEVLARLWAPQLTEFTTQNGLSTPVSMAHLIIVALTLIPAFVVMSSSPISIKMHERLIGALLFALLAITLLFEPLANMFLADSIGLTVKRYVELYAPIIVTISLVAALIDIMMYKRPKVDSKKR